MNTESFNTKYKFMPVTVSIDNEGDIVEVCVQGTKLSLEIPEDEMVIFLAQTEKERQAILDENERDASDYFDHINQQSDRKKFI